MGERFMDLSGFKDLDARSVKLRSLTGNDTVVAAGRVAPLEGGTLDPTLFSIMLRQHQIAQSIIEVNGEPVRGPCLSFIGWNARTRELVARIYDRLNGITTEEEERFLTALNGASADQTTVAESADV